jgi:hypothetical protein
VPVRVVLVVAHLHAVVQVALNTHHGASSGQYVELSLRLAACGRQSCVTGRWAVPAEFPDAALPSLFH